MHINISANQTLLFVGDSITDCGRKEHGVPLGVGYVRMFSDLLTIREPAKQIKIINRGISGNTVDDLRSRWTDHVLANRPDWLVIKIGINDVNRHLRCQEPDSLQSPGNFAAIYDQILARTRQELPHTQILLASPFYASLDKAEDSFRSKVQAVIPEYVASTKATARQYGARFVDLHAAFATLLRDLPPDVLAEDAVHPTTAGALFIAEQIYAALL
jgi:lysophospholipase L1-like esterase